MGESKKENKSDQQTTSSKPLYNSVCIVPATLSTEKKLFRPPVLTLRNVNKI